MYKGVVKWNGNHYFKGQEVIGSKFRELDGVVEIFDDEEQSAVIDGHHFDFTRHEWVEVDKESFEELPQ